MPALSGLLTNLRTKLAEAPASLTPLPQNFSPGDTADTDKTYFTVSVRTHGALRELHGAGQVDYVAEVEVRVVWTVDVDREALYNTTSDDLENIDATVLKASNWTSGIVNVVPAQPFVYIDDDQASFLEARGTYSVHFRLAHNLT